jgi:hypothetical protein
LFGQAAEFHLSHLSAELQFECRTITNLSFADDIDGLAGDILELKKLIKQIDSTSRSYRMKINDEKTKLMTNKSKQLSQLTKNHLKQ